ncbi:MAG: T9SS type A sorting domain-containing protein [Bacteroidota bacterium]
MKKILLLFITTRSILFAATYYSQGSFDAAQFSSWNSIRGGGGNTPSAWTNGDTFIIQNGHYMTTSAAWSISGTGNKLQIENGGLLTATFRVSTTTFQIDNGGTFICNINTDANGFAAYIPGSTTKSFGSNSTIEIQQWGTGAGTSPNPLPSGVSWGNLVINVSTLGGSWQQDGKLSTVQGNLIIQNTGGTTRAFRLTASNDLTVNISGDLIISGGIFDLVSTSAIVSVNIGGNFNQTGGTLQASSSTSTPTISFTGSGKTFTYSSGTLSNANINWNINSGASLTLVNDLPVAASRTLTVNGTLGCSTNNITGLGTFTLASGGTLGIGSSDGIVSSGSSGNIQTTTRNYDTSANYTYNGSSSQNTGNGLPSTVNNLTINNSSGVALTNSITVNGTLTLTNGNITTGSNTLTVGSNGSVSRSSGHIIGSLKKSLSSSSATFEVGTINGYTPLSFANILGTGEFTVKTVSEKHPNAVGNNVLGMYWTLTNGGITSADLQLTYLDGDVTGTESNYAIGKYSGGNWSFPSTSLNTANNTASTSGVSSFSDFTLGEVSALPVELNMFAAKVKNNIVQLIWSTATEVNNYGFDIERKSINGGWTKIGFVRGYGNSSSPKNYVYTDQPLGDVLFNYRLKQIDFDGTFEYSSEVEVKLDNVKQFTLEQNYPNPFNPTTTIRFSLPFSANVSISVFTLLGEKVAVLVNGNLNPGYHEVLFDGSHLTSGIYFYQLRAGDYKATKKFIITK